MTEIMPVPRNLNFTVLSAGSVCGGFCLLFRICKLPAEAGVCYARDYLTGFESLSDTILLKVSECFVSRQK